MWPPCRGPRGLESAYQHVRGFFGLKDLADANRTKKKKKVVKTVKAGAPSSSAAIAGKTLPMVSSSQAQLTADLSGTMVVASIPLTRGAGKSSLEQDAPVAKRAKANTSYAKAGINVARPRSSLTSQIP
ncbi:unnamed protein product [Linum trigynum]|uniref:Uncharacterized protein n=1 Tax=Linum trigynum TaxID=586398 RepID=A0AAV2GJ43_9ROSI